MYRVTRKRRSVSGWHRALAGDWRKRGSLKLKDGVMATSADGGYRAGHLGCAGCGRPGRGRENGVEVLGWNVAGWRCRWMQTRD
jgi:hypothetical protein